MAMLVQVARLVARVRVVLTGLFSLLVSG